MIKSTVLGIQALRRLPVLLDGGERRDVDAPRGIDDNGAMINFDKGVLSKAMS